MAEDAGQNVAGYAGHLDADHDHEHVVGGNHEAQPDRRAQGHDVELRGVVVAGHARDSSEGHKEDGKTVSRARMTTLKLSSINNAGEDRLRSGRQDHGLLARTEFLPGMHLHAENCHRGCRSATRRSPRPSPASSAAKKSSAPNSRTTIATERANSGQNARSDGTRSVTEILDLLSCEVHGEALATGKVGEGGDPRVETDTDYAAGAILSTMRATVLSVYCRSAAGKTPRTTAITTRGAAMAISRRLMGRRASACGPLYSGPR